MEIPDNIWSPVAEADNANFKHVFSAFIPAGQVFGRSGSQSRSHIIHLVLGMRCEILDNGCETNKSRTGLTPRNENREETSV